MCSLMFQFQSTLPRGERRKAGSIVAAYAMVSIHAPTRGATAVNGVWIVGRDVSIHAPTRGATQGRLSRTGHRDVSIHAPTRGATALWDFAVATGEFQSTLPRGERRDVSRLSPMLIGVSIHAPTRGATKIARVLLPGILFQSTLPRGERLEVQIISHLVACFNPRSHAGSDLGRQGQALSLDSFNPRSHAGSDPICRRSVLSVMFQSTLPRGERRAAKEGIYLPEPFQSTLPRGERRHPSSPSP